MSGSIGRSVTTVLCGRAADSVNGGRGEIERNYAKMFHVKHRGAGGRRRRKWFHVKHPAADWRGSFLRKSVSRETSLDGRVGIRKHEKCKTTPCIKKSSLYFNHMTLRRFGTSETVRRTLRDAQRRDGGTPLFPAGVSSASMSSCVSGCSCYLRDQLVPVGMGAIFKVDPAMPDDQVCLTGSRPDFSATFTTVAFDDSSLRWLEINT